jgi:[acyl-carrier-protein] S-malonyltransferase
MNWIALFPGQGSQHPQMGLDLFNSHEETLIEKFEMIMGWSLKDACEFANENELKKTNIAQPSIFALSYSYCLEAIKKYGKPSALAGHSLGEYTALAISGVMNFEDALEIISVRSNAMQDAVERIDSSMCAVLTKDMETTIKDIDSLEKQGIDIWAANFNDPGQIVVAGLTEDLDYIVKNPKSISARKIIKLDVAGAFHTPLMSPAKARLDIALDKIPFNEPFIPTVMNVDANYVTKDTVKKQLSDQIDNPVLFLNQLQRLENDINPDKWMHIGPGDVTSGMAKRSISSKEVGVVNSLDSLN